MSFEQLAISRLVTDPAYLKRVIPHLLPEYFHDLSERKIFEIIQTYTNKYKTAPSVEAIAIILNESALPEAIYENCLTVIQSIEPSDKDFDWMVDQTEKLAQDKAIYNGIMQSIGILDGKDKKLDKNAIPGILSKALSVDFNTKLGHNYFKDSEAQYEYMHSDETRFPFSIDVLNRATNGGIKTKGTLNVVMMEINGGKSTWLINQAAEWLAAGKNVVHITLEIDEPSIRERGDVCIHDLTFDKLHSLEKTQYLNRIRMLREKTTGEYVIKQFASGSHTGHFRHFLEELRLKQGFKPHLIVVDYLTICGSSMLPASARGNSDTYFTAVAEELRALAIEYQCAMWSALQYDRTGQAGGDVSIGNTGLSLGIQKTADFTLAITAPEELASRDLCAGKILKSRYSNKSKIRKFIMGLDNTRQKFFNTDTSFQAEAMNAEELAEMNAPKQESNAPPNKVTDWKFS